VSGARTESIATSFVSRQLNDMCGGTIELSVPLRDDVVQIGAGGDVDVGRIRVSNAAGSITVVRVDGRPIQVEVVTGDGLATRVFCAPVPRVLLVRFVDPTGRARWQPSGAAAQVRRASLLKQFADVLGTFVTAKQSDHQHSQRGWRDHRLLTVEPVRTSNSSVVSNVGGGSPA